MSRNDLPEFCCPMSDEDMRRMWKAENEQDVENEITRERARERGLESFLEMDEYGRLEYPKEKYLSKIEEIKLDDRVCGNVISLLYIAEINKWTVDLDWFAKDYFSGCCGYPHPLWSTLYDTREDALSVAWRWFEKKGVKRPYVQLDLFEGDYS